MKAYLINPDEATITEIEYNGDWRTITEHLGGAPVRFFTTVALNHDHDAIFVDDEGLINDNPHGWFELQTYNQPLKGLGLVLGVDEAGMSVAPVATLEQVKALVKFPKFVNEALIDRQVRIRSL